MAEKDNKYYWLKLKRDFFKRHDIQIIEAMPNGKDYILFYLKLLCESIDHDGNLRFSDTIPYNDTMLSVITNTNVDIVRNAIKIFSELQMIDILDDGTYYMAEVSKMIGAESYWAGKKRSSRELLDNVQQMSNACPTCPSKSKSKSIDIDIYKYILSFWNEKDIIKHQKLSDDIKKAIDKCLLKYSQEEICKAIDNYSKVLHDKDSLFNYKWSLQDFLNRKNGIQTFMDDGSNWVNYISNTKTTNKKMATEPNWMKVEYFTPRDVEVLSDEEIEKNNELIKKVFGNK